MDNSNYQLAEMVNSANYAAMSYNELVTIKMAFHLALLEVTPLIEKKRAEEIATHTHEYVAIMNNYGSSKAEILTCLERAVLRETPYGPFTPQDVDDQTARRDSESMRWDESPSNVSYLLLPAPKDADTTDSNETSQDDEKNLSEAIPTEVVEAHETNEPESDVTITTKTKEQFLAEQALEAVGKEPIPNYIDVQTPYFIENEIRMKEDGTVYFSTTRKGRNLGIKDLETFRSAVEKYESLFMKRKVLVSTDDYLVAYNGGETVYVYRYHSPEGYVIQEGPSAEESIVSGSKLEALKRTNAFLNKAIKKAKELSALGEPETNRSFYDRYIFNHHGCNRLDLRGDRERYYENVAMLKEILPAFETYVGLCDNQFRVLAKDNCIAAMGTDHVFVVMFNIPSQDKTEEHITKRRGRPKKSVPAANEALVFEESKAITSTSTIQTVDDLILEAVDLTRSMPLTNGTDANRTYYLQSSFSVTNEGALIYSGKPFSSNVSLDDLDRCQRKHEKYARTMKASKIVAADGYTAFVSNDGKTITVYYYFTNAANARNS